MLFMLVACSKMYQCIKKRNINLQLQTYQQAVPFHLQIPKTTKLRFLMTITIASMSPVFNYMVTLTRVDIQL